MDWLAALPTALVVIGLVSLYVWLGRSHRRSWDGAPRQQPGRSGPIVRESTWMRGGGGQS